MEPLVISNHIFEVRGMKIMLDFDLASLYGIGTKVLKQAVRRNIERFPNDFMFQLTDNEWDVLLRSHFVTLKAGTGRQPKYLPFAFTEHGVAMLASVLNSPKAIQLNIVIIRAFIALRTFAINYQELADKLTQLEHQFQQQFSDVYEVLHYLMKEQEKTDVQTARKRIGFKS